MKEQKRISLIILSTQQLLTGFIYQHRKRTAGNVIKKGIETETGHTSLFLLFSEPRDPGNEAGFFSLLCQRCLQSLTKQIENLYAPYPQPRPQARMGKWRVLAFARLHPWFGGGMGVGGSILFCPRLQFIFLRFCQLSFFATFSEEISCKLQKSQLLVRQIYR